MVWRVLGVVAAALFVFARPALDGVPQLARPLLLLGDRVEKVLLAASSVWAPSSVELAVLAEPVSLGGVALLLAVACAAGDRLRRVALALLSIAVVALAVGQSGSLAWLAALAVVPVLLLLSGVALVLPLAAASSLIAFVNVQEQLRLSRAELGPFATSFADGGVSALLEGAPALAPQLFASLLAFMLAAAALRLLLRPL